MLRRKIPNTDLEVSPLCLGTMTFGNPVEEERAVAMVRPSRKLQPHAAAGAVSPLSRLGLVVPLSGAAALGLAGAGSQRQVRPGYLCWLAGGNRPLAAVRGESGADARAQARRCTAHQLQSLATTRGGAVPAQGRSSSGGGPAPKLGALERFPQLARCLAHAPQAAAHGAPRGHADVAAVSGPRVRRLAQRLQAEPRHRNDPGPVEQPLPGLRVETMDLVDEGGACRPAAARG